MAGAIVSTPPIVEPPPSSTSGSTSILGPFPYTYAITTLAQTWTASQNFAGGITLNGTLVGSNLPLPTAATLGGVKSYASVANQFLISIGTDGVPVSAQPSFGNISGTVAAAQLPTPTATTLGGVKSLAAVATKYLTSIGTDGTPVAAQPVWSDISGVPQTTVDTIAALKALDKTKYNRALVVGYYALGDCRWRVYYYDSADTTSADNGGSIIVATDGGRWKLAANTIWTCKTFGAKDDGTDQATALGTAISTAAAANVALEWDGNFSVSALTVTGLSGLYWIGKGGLIGIASTAQDAILGFINCQDVSIDGRFVVNGNFNTNYSYGLHAYTNAAAQTLQLFNLSNIIFNGCKIAWAFGSTARPDDTISEINIFGGRTSGCPGIGIGIGKNTVVNTHGCTWFSSYGTGGAPWQALPIVGVEAKGATINVNGGELLRTEATTGQLTLASGLTSASGNVYGNINVKGAVIECANVLAGTTVGGATSPTGGSIQFSGGNRLVLTSDVAGGAIQTDSTYTGPITVLGNSGFASVARTQVNINAGNSASVVTFDLPSFGANCLQGYAGVSGGTQYLVSKDIAPGVVVTDGGTHAATQGKADSIVTLNPTAAFTYTMLSAAVYPGRTLYLNNAAAFAVNSASSNILLPTGVATNSILPALGGSWVILISDTSQGNFWRVVASGAPPSGAVLQTAVTAPAGTTSATGVMMGMGSTCTITPKTSSRVLVSFTGDTTNTAVNTNTANVRYGTGGAPANGAALAGTAVLGNSIGQVISTASAPASFNLGGVITGLTPGTAYWLDMSLGTNGGTASLSNMNCTIVEL